MTVAFDRETFLKQFFAMDGALVSAGFPATSPWWRGEIERFARSGRRRWIVRVGRRGGKSTTLARLAVAWAWLGAWHVPPGDVGVVMFVSVNRDESAMRLRTIAALLTALGLPFDQRNDEVELLGERRVLFRTAACTTTSVVGFTSIAVFCDEAARWESRDTASNPAQEVVASLAPTLATQEHGFMVLCSSPWSTDDFHAQLFDAGDDDHQITSFAETWIANPTISETRTHELEPDLRVWQREYAAMPGATLSNALDAQDVNACFDRAAPAWNHQATGFCVIDASSLRGDTFAFMCGFTATVNDVELIVVREIGGFDGQEQRHVSMSDIVRHIAERARAVKAWEIYGDQREEASLRSMFNENALVFTSYPWSEPSKDNAMQLLRRLLLEQRIILPEHAELKRQLTSMKSRLVPSGRIRYETNGLDYASCLITLCHAIADNKLLGGSMTSYRSTPRIPRLTDDPFGTGRRSGYRGPRIYSGPGATHDFDTGRPLRSPSAHERFLKFGY